MKLSERLRGIMPPLAPAHLPEPRNLIKEIKPVDEVFSDITPTQTERDHEVIALAFQRRITVGDWANCTVEDMAAAFRAAFDKALQDRADLAPLRDFLLREAGVTRHGRILKAMLDVHMDRYVQKSEHTRTFAKGLKARIDQLPVRSQELLKMLPEALDPNGGATALGKRMAEADDVATVFAGLPAIPSGGLVDEAGEAFIAKLAPRMADQATARRVLNWFAPEDGRGRAVGAHLAIDALLSPWQQNEPADTWKRTLIDRLVAAYDDPRIMPGGAWGQVHPDAVETFIRWQTGATLSAFMDIVSQAEDSHMWGDRRPFWEDLYEQGHIQSAWVAFSKKAAAIATKKANESGDRSLRNFGRQIAGGGRVDTSLLILKINGMTVVEGSHSYKVHVFPRDHRKTPKLFQYRYDCEEIRLSLIETHKRTHLGEEWKNFVRRETGCLR